MADDESSHELSSGFRTSAATASERDRLASDLEIRQTKLNEQARIFVPLIALCLIVAMPVWSQSLTRFLLLLLSPFVLLPVGFCVAHLVISWRGIAKAKSRISELERVDREI
jgi:hypothetical protein